MEKYFDTIIVGGGASGLFCGASLIEYNKRNKSFMILEKSHKIGLKLLVSGSGQCNFTHSGDIKDFISFYGDKGKKIRGILFKFNNQMTIDYFENRGVKTVTREDGKVFPASLKAADIQSLLLSEIENNGGMIKTSSTVVSIAEDSSALEYVVAVKPTGQLENQNTQNYRCKNLVIAAGGKSYPKTGSDGKLLETIGHSFNDLEIIEQEGALVPIYVEDYNYNNISGIAIRDAVISKGKIKAKGDVLFTHKNLSGPLILNFSRYLRGGDKFYIDYLPAGFKSGEHLNVDGEKRSILNYLIDETSLPKAFLESLLANNKISSRDKASTLKGREVKAIEKSIRNEEFIVNGKAGFDKAMVTSGGVSLKEVATGNLQSKKHPGLYFIGEILDVDGDTGGYNIQFAFSTGYIAAQHILQLP